MNRIVVPSIHEINSVLAGSNGFKAVSTFAGGGGSSTGYKWAGFDVPLAVEFVDKAAETYRANAPSTKVLQADIRTLSADDILNEIGLDVGQLDLLDGSPPCQAFSTGGVRDKGWGKEKQYSGAVHQRTDDLFFEYIRLIKGIQPKVFVAENVTGLVSGVARGYFAEIFNAMREITPKYRVAAMQVEGVRLGLPQKRNRIIFVAVRDDLGLDPVYPTPLPLDQFVSAREAFEGLPAAEPGTFEALKTHNRDGAINRTRMAWENVNLSLEPDGCFRHAYQRLGWGDSRYMWFRIPPNDPAPTVTGKVACLTHWSEPRSLSLAEAKRLQSFPDDYALTDGFKPQWERLGRAVPPLMMKRISETIAREILEKIR